MRPEPGKNKITITYADTGEPVKPVNAEYLRRNLLHCKAVGVAAGIHAVLARLGESKRSPKWMLKISELCP